MARIYVMQAGQSTWEAQDRFESAAGTPITEEGRRRVREVANQLSREGVTVVYSGGGESDRASAREASDALGVKPRRAQGLREVDYGLWQGLTREELKRRHPKVFRRWKEAPQAVHPPEGETLGEAQGRLLKAVKGIVKRHKNGTVLLVLRPLAMGLLRCALQGDDIDEVWENVDPSFTWQSYEAS